MTLRLTDLARGVVWPEIGREQIASKAEMPICSRAHWLPPAFHVRSGETSCTLNNIFDILLDPRESGPRWREKESGPNLSQSPASTNR